MKRFNLEDEDEDMTPNTPVIKDSTKRDKSDQNEFLLGDDEVLDDESDTLEEYYED